MSKETPKRINSDDVVLAHTLTQTHRHTRTQQTRLHVLQCVSQPRDHNLQPDNTTASLSLCPSLLPVALTSAKTPTHVCAKPTKMPPLGMHAESTQRSLSEMRTLFAQEMCSTCSVLVRGHSGNEQLFPLLSFLEQLLSRQHVGKSFF